MIAESRGDPIYQKDFLWFRSFEQHQTKSDPAAPSHQVLSLILGTMSMSWDKGAAPQPLETSVNKSVRARLTGKQ